MTANSWALCSRVTNNGVTVLEGGGTKYPAITIGVLREPLIGKLMRSFDLSPFLYMK